MATAWLRPRPRSLVPLRRETQASRGVRAHCVSAWDILLLTRDLAKRPPLLLSCTPGEAAVLPAFLFLACSTPSFLPSSLAIPNLMLSRSRRRPWVLFLGDSRRPWVRFLGDSFAPLLSGSAWWVAGFVTVLGSSFGIL